ncbi:GNAT family N-acetyltransferase [Exiguobacterium sp. KRL4]|uniref:GNAT family N-acetyltransferase n=1 Tax=Exiguobacterium sp. KRL4 TaxID=1914536 RepID=UPI0008F9731E|nr:GNAT family N-acetyltransferase [Exiguobacterium sp. KRL4]OIN65543.1 GNAT family N-acetyltransferase [Exiguobacterium sp. KRL4]
MMTTEFYQHLPVLETERLILRPLQTGDLDDLFEYTQDEETARYVTWNANQTVEQAEQFLNYVLSNYEQGKEAPWAIVWKETGKMIGTIDFIHLLLDDTKQAELGYAISRQFWGKGIVTEAVACVMAFGFEELRLERIQARCMEGNVGSARVMEKVGMTYEGTLRRLIFIKEAFHDVKMYSMLREEYTVLRQGSAQQTEQHQ